jgi:hypothetical protein
MCNARKDVRLHQGLTHLGDAFSVSPELVKCLVGGNLYTCQRQDVSANTDWCRMPPNDLGHLTSRHALIPLGSDCIVLSAKVEIAALCLYDGFNCGL